jgi:ABC-type sulfate/molybdate transport systems ATPase subunit
VLLLDEPTSALDEDARTAVEETLVELRERLGISIVLVTHDLDQARRLADWVVRIDVGRVAAQGPAGEVIPA